MIPSSALLAIGIDVEGFAVPGHALRLNLISLWIAIAVAMDRYLGADGNGSFFQTCLTRASRRREREIPDLAVRANLHCCVRSGKAHAAFHNSGEFKFLFEVSAPTVVGGSWKRQKRKREKTRANAKRDSKTHGFVSFVAFLRP